MANNEIAGDKAILENVWMNFLQKIHFPVTPASLCSADVTLCNKEVTRRKMCRKEDC